MNAAIMTCQARQSLVEDSLWKYPKKAQIYVSPRLEGPAWNLERIFADNLQESGVLVLQDDLIIPEWFEEQFEAALIPDQVMTFHTHSPTVRSFYDQGFSYAWAWQVWGQANYYPAWFLKGYFEWTKEVPPLGEGYEKKIWETVYEPEDFVYRRHAVDDGCVTACLLWLRKKALLTLPELVQHDTSLSSVRGNEHEKSPISHLFGSEYLRPWKKRKIATMPPLWVLRAFVHPSRIGEFRPEELDFRETEPGFCSGR